MYNTVNQRTKTTLADDSYWDYTYDDLGQVTSGRKYTSAGTQISGRQSVYDQDEIGNRITSSTPGYVPYTVNDDNQYTIMRDVSLTYDPAGNLLTNGSWTYSWDNENRLIQVVSTSKLIKFSYDTQGRRIEKKVWNNTTGTGTPATHLKYIYDGWNLIAELNGNSSNAKVRTYTWGLDASGSTQGAGGVEGLLFIDDSTSGVHFVSYDLNGNVMGLVKAADGTVSAAYEYGPFGELLVSTGTMSSSNPFRFSTKYRDSETDLYYYGYRYYSPDMGRWLSRDPIEEQGDLNLYSFVNNDPVNKWDRLGLQGWITPPQQTLLPLPYPTLGRRYISDPPFPIKLDPLPPPPFQCRLEICCKSVLFLQNAHCVLRFTYPDGRVSGCRGGSTSGSRIGSISGGGNRQSEHCKGDCELFGNIIAGCGDGINDESKPLEYGIWEDLEDARKNPSHCELIEQSERVCSMEARIDQEMREITSKCYIYHPLSGPNSNTVWYNALANATGIIRNPKGYQPSRMIDFNKSKTCKEKCKGRN